MTSPEQYRGHEKEIDEQSELDRLAKEADAAREAGVYNPREFEGER